MDKSKAHFVLIHGACHGAWCWYKVATLLQTAGFRVSALDLAASGVHPKRLDEVGSVFDYFEPLMEFMAALPAEDRVVLVGHSMGGISISVAMERFPQKIAVAVFVTAFMPCPNLNIHTIIEECRKGFDDYMDSQFRFDQGPDKPPTSIVFGPMLLSSKFYQLSPKEDLTLATLLVKPFPHYDWAQTSMKTRLTWENFGSVSRVYIVSEQDYVINEENQRWMIANNPTDEVKVICGSDHMVMLSKPQELFSCLQEIAQQSW